MKNPILRGQTGNIAFVFVPDSTSTVGAGKTGLTNASAGLNVAVRREKSAAFTSYTGANIGAIATLGTWANPGTGKVNFKECDSANAPGLYELHFVDAICDASDTSRKLLGMVQVTGGAPSPFEIPLWAVDHEDAVAFGMSRLDAAISTRSTYAGSDTSGTTTLLGRLTSGRATALDFLDVSISSRLAASSYTAPANPSDYARNNVAPSWWAAPPTDYQQRAVAVTLPSNPPAGFLVTASYSTAPGWYTVPANVSDYARNNVAPSWAFDPTAAIPLRNQDAVIDPTYNDAFAGAWHGAFGPEAESDSLATYAKTMPAGASIATLRTFTLDEDADSNPIGRH